MQFITSFRKNIICISLIISILILPTCKKDDAKQTDIFVSSGFHKIEKSAISGIQINSILVDDQGYKWIGTNSGLVLYANSTWYEYTKLKNITTFSINNENKKILIATSNGAYTIISGKEELTLSETLKGSDVGSTSDTVYVYKIDKYNNIWLGSPDGLSFNNGSGWKRNKQIKLNLGGLKEIRSIAFRQDEVFFSTYGKFLYHLKLQETDFDAVSGASQMIGGAENPINNFNGQLTTDTIFCVYADNDTALWFGSKDGLTKNKGNTHVSSGLFEYFLRGEKVHYVMEASDKKIWAGTENGVYVKNGEDWQKYSTSDGLVGNVIKCISEDTDNSLWISTDKGISHYINGKFIKP